MPTLQGHLKTITGSPSTASEVWLSVNKSRRAGNAVVTPEKTRVQVTGGAFRVTLDPGPAVMTIFHTAGARGEVVPLMVESSHTTIAQAVEAAQLADAAGSQLRRLAARVQADMETAVAAKDAAESYKTAAASSASTASSYRSQTWNYRTAALAAKTDAETAKDQAVAAKTAAASSETTASNAAARAESAKDAAETAKSAAESAKASAQTYKNYASTYKNAAESAKTAAEAARDRAETAAANAETGAPAGGWRKSDLAQPVQDTLNAVAGKAPASHTHVSADITDTHPDGHIFPGKIAAFSSQGYLYAHTGDHAYGLTNKQYVDSRLEARAFKNHRHTSSDITDATHNGRGSSSSGKLVEFTTGGNFFVGDPQVSFHVTNKQYVDDTVEPVEQRVRALESAPAPVPPLFTGMVTIYLNPNGRFDISRTSTSGVGTGTEVLMRVFSDNVLFKKSFTAIALYNGYARPGFIFTHGGSTYTSKSLCLKKRQSNGSFESAILPESEPVTIDAYGIVHHEDNSYYAAGSAVTLLIIGDPE